MWTCNNCKVENPDHAHRCAVCMAWPPKTQRALAKLRNRGQRFMSTMPPKDVHHVPLCKLVAVILGGAPNEN